MKDLVFLSNEASKNKGFVPAERKLLDPFSFVPSHCFQKDSNRAFFISPSGKALIWANI
jgi:hypothetical protein